ncbi:MAG: adenylate kinase [Gomphosphaeria aponina SAG 52.96 = DSM 107014]|uniref:Adenylate kinase n=1 Tax=Gomphosphaeria aponina SAG 52.96 = DSM 107014 TaxID=1521640 RepID=A0A941GUG7_9CHRO|nr:adenylate kinase [Gomphosphaeria aponina SAG 52.96 = DSM 107014]
MKKKLIFLGAPGAGKGTQSEVLAGYLEIQHISTGEILRKAIAEKTELGQKAQSYVDQGELVPDELILDLIRECLNKPSAHGGWILDGFPRNVAQASFLDQLLTEVKQTAEGVVNIEVPDEVLIERLLARGRKDDNLETITRRLKVYREQTAPVIDYYRQQGKLHEINGHRPLGEVTNSLKEMVKD